MDPLDHHRRVLRLPQLVDARAGADVPRRPPAYRAGWRRVAAVGGLAAYAGSIELVQPLLTKTGRQFERLDLMCNLVGVVAGWTLFAALAGRLQAEEEQVR